jgi:hypothetical protein
MTLKKSPTSKSSMVSSKSMAELSTKSNGSKSLQVDEDEKKNGKHKGNAHAGGGECPGGFAGLWYLFLTLSYCCTAYLVNFCTFLLYALSFALALASATILESYGYLTWKPY